ncbi:MAG: response regulator [Methylotenera sp.]|nr:response regulator [Oligoflexia bacterium]
MKRFPIVGIGASAGGLEALTQLLTQLPIDTGMGFVLLQHLDPNHESMSAEILSRVTRMEVSEVKNGMAVQPNRVYVLPANSSMGILNGVLNLMPRTETHGLHLVIDSFFQSLAKDSKNRAVGVILSGTGSDGTPGLMAIKAEGGITFAQDPQSARFDGMPQSSIDSGAVDFVLNPERIAEELARIAHQPYVKPDISDADEEFAGKAGDAGNTGDETLSPQDSLNHIFLLLRNLCHVDFAHYKSNTIGRRIDRRMVLCKVKDQNAYAQLLSHDPGEVKALFDDLLINVTSFFRDPEAFKALTEKVFPKLVENRAPGTPIRVWSMGCSTGEEAYSIAISLLEYLGDKASSTPIQVFGSDISEQAIQKARLGEYPETIAREVSRERLNRYFTKMDTGGYKIAKSIRDICVFSRHDITTDPPFAKIDLLSCRNLLIYFTANLQKHVFPIFHYALSPKGFLWLGKSETIGGFVNLFSSVDKKNNIYARKTAPHALNLSFPASSYVPGLQGIHRKPTPPTKVGVDVQKIADGAVQEQFPGVLINEEMDILQFRGHTNPFIHPAPGLPSHNLLKMANLEILSDLRSAIQAARKHKTAVKKDGLRISEGRSSRTFNLRVIPVKPTQPGLGKDYYYLIQFEDVAETRSRKIKTTSGKRKDPRVVELQQELMAAQEYQQSLVEKSVAAQENLTTSNEELQSANEELQSTNEELETAKEELQSGNEELTTVNDELRTRSLEQAQSNNDLTNLLASVQIAIVMLGFDNKIRRFTPLAGSTLNLIPSDVGRPFSDMKLNFSMQGVDLNLEEMVSQVAETMEPREVEVQDRRGRWFRLQVRPYKTSDGKIDGAVLALVDIDALILSFKEVEASKAEAEKANRAKDLFLATLSHELRTPLTAILSWAEMIESGNLGAEKIRRAGAIIRDCGKTQAALIDDLLDVSRIIVGKLALELREVQPEDMICKAIESVLSMAKKKTIQIETYFDPQAGTVMADPVRLQQVFLNLLTNAIKFSSPHSKVMVRLEKVKDQGGEKAKVMIKVIDSGKGINPEFIPHLFNSFSQEDSSSIRVHGGLGLGLAIVRSLVELHGGSIHAESPGEKLGATFTVTLPRKSEFTSSEQMKREEENKTHQPQISQVRLDGLKVLVVEDEDATREVFTEMLTFFGAVVTPAASAKEALAVFQNSKPDVLLSDISMPGEDGYSLIRKIRALRPAQGGNIPAIAVTAHAGPEDIRAVLSAGFQSHVAKPVDSVHLATIIARVAATRVGG